MNNKIRNLFERYQSGQATKQERKIVEDWFAGFDNEHVKDLSLERKQEIFSSMDENIDRMLFNKRRALFDNRWLYAAAAVVLVCSGIVFFKHDQTAIKNNTGITYSTVIAPRGTKKQLALPDGSLVNLNSGSRISIPSDFGVKSRQVLLSGEAFFVVKHDATRPFSIHSGKLLITDLGTSFDVKAYPEDQKMHVAVESGEVRVEKHNAGGKAEVFAMAMTRNQQLVYDESKDTHVVRQVQVANLIAWRQNKLRFDNASMDDIAHTLGRWYNVTVKFDNYKACRRYTASFNNEPLEHVLSVLNRLTGLTYQINNGVLSINLKNCKA